MGPNCKIEETTGKGFGTGLSRCLWPLDVSTLCAKARRRAGSDDFGDPPLEPALSILVKSLDDEANLHPLGRFLMRAHLLDLLTTRLRLVSEWKRRAEPLDIVRPVFITGMPRSGSTFLHELLAQDPDNRVPQVWEVMFPLAAPGRRQDCPNRYIRKAEACLWLFRKFAPGADSVHPIRAHTPQECVAIHSYTLLSEEFVTTCNVPGYESFLHKTELGPVYAWQKRFLQHLQSNHSAQRWVLKSPDHVYGLEALFSAFPDALVVQTHRNPVDVLKSSLRMLEVLQGAFTRPLDRKGRGLREARILAGATERFIRFRESHPELSGRFIDLRYSDLIAEPLPAIRRIYQHLDAPLPENIANCMGRFVSNRSRYRNPRRIHTLSDLGLDSSEEARSFKRYCFRFGIPWQVG